MKKKYLKEIERINAGIPKELLDKLIIKKSITPTTIEIMERAIANPEEVAGIVSKEEIEKYKAILKSGRANIEIEVEDPEIAKKIEEYLDAEFKKARKLGRLPPPQRFPKLKIKAKQNYVQSIQNEKAESNK